MITALLLPLLLAGTTTDGAPAAHRAVAGDEPAIQIWISNDRRFLAGDRGKVQVRTREDGYLIVLHADPDGHLRVLFPLDPTDDNFVRGGRKYEIRGRGGRESFTVDNSRGRGTVYAAVAHEPYRFDDFVLSDHWDYRNLSPQRLPADPEPDLNDLVRRMASGSFDYDILTYDVLERVVYANDYSTGYSYYDGYGSGCAYSYYRCGRAYYGSPFSLSVGLFFGRPYRRYYDPFYPAYDPFYDPFFYDPYYYRPVSVYPYRTYGYYGYPYRNAYWYNTPGRGYWNRPYTPYRFRSGTTLGGYRDRRFDLRSVNTVYLPPRVSARQPVNSNPIRRATATEPRPAAQPSTDRNLSPTRTTGRERDARSTPAKRNEVRPNIEARRAREPEPRRGIISDSRERGALPTEARRAQGSGTQADNGARRAPENRPEPQRAEPRRAEPQRAEPQRAEPRRAEPQRAEPRRAEPQRAQPQRSESRPAPRDGGGIGRSGGERGGGGGGRRR
jgi:hypothetical protein